MTVMLHIEEDQQSLSFFRQEMKASTLFLQFKCSNRWVSFGKKWKPSLNYKYLQFNSIHAENDFELSIITWRLWCLKKDGLLELQAYDAIARWNIIDTSLWCHRKGGNPRYGARESWRWNFLWWQLDRWNISKHDDVLKCPVSCESAAHLRELQMPRSWPVDRSLSLLMRSEFPYLSEEDDAGVDPSEDGVRIL